MSMITHLIIILYKFSRAISDLHFRNNIACFCSIVPMEIVITKDHSTVLHPCAMDGVYSLNEYAFWMNRMNKLFNDSLINTFKYLGLFLNMSSSAILHPCVLVLRHHRTSKFSSNSQERMCRGRMNVPGCVLDIEDVSSAQTSENQAFTEACKI